MPVAAPASDTIKLYWWSENYIVTHFGIISWNLYQWSPRRSGFPLWSCSGLSYLNNASGFDQPKSFRPGWNWKATVLHVAIRKKDSNTPMELKYSIFWSWAALLLCIHNLQYIVCTHIHRLIHNTNSVMFFSLCASFSLSLPRFLHNPRPMWPVCVCVYVRRLNAQTHSNALHLYEYTFLLLFLRKVSKKLQPSPLSKLFFYIFGLCLSVCVSVWYFMCAHLRFQLRQWHQFLRQQSAPPLHRGPSSILCVRIKHTQLSLTLS